MTCDVWVDKDKLPSNFELLNPSKQDEILYELQLKKQDIWQDTYYGECVNVVPVRELKAISNA